MSLDWVFWAIGIWFLIGAICAGLVYQDQADRKAKGWKWPLLAYRSASSAIIYTNPIRNGFATPEGSCPLANTTRPQSTNSRKPSQEPAEAKTEPLTSNETAKTVAAPSPPEEPAVVPLAPPPVQRDARMAEERVDPSRPKVQKIKGIPRCENCGAAVSSYDMACNNCGAPLKH